MFNLQGSELVIILLLALVVLGPEKLPEAMRKAGQFYAELKKMSSGFQAEFRSVVDEPLRELKETANTIRDSADFTKLQSGERPEKPKSADMVAAADPDQVPTDDLPFTPERDELASDDGGSEGAAPIEPSEQQPFSSVIVSGGAASVPQPSTGPASDVGDDTGPEPAAEAAATEQPPRPTPFSGAQQSSAAPRQEPELPPDPVEVADTGDDTDGEDAE